MSGPRKDGCVGYGNAPREHRWKRGQSGNPRGRPRRPKRPPPDGFIEALARAFSAEIVMVRGGKKTRVPRFEAWAEHFVRESLNAPPKEKLILLSVLARLGVTEQIKFIRQEDDEAILDAEIEKTRVLFEQVKSELRMD